MKLFFERNWQALKRAILNAVIYIFRNNQKAFHKLLLFYEWLDGLTNRNAVNGDRMPVALPAAPGRGINIHGFMRGDFGLGSLAMYNLQAIKAANIPFTLNDIKKRMRGHMAETVSGTAQYSPYATNLICVNADGLRYFMRTSLGQVTHGRYNIACWVWELSRFPAQWHKSFKLCDEIWVPSSFCQEALVSVSPVPVFKTFSLQIDKEGIRSDKHRFGIKDDAYAFLFIFDFHSYFRRKNPLALIKAFKQAFSTTDNAVFVLKYMNQTGYPHYVKELNQAIAQYSNIRIIDERLSKAEVYNLMASCDCYASLHRAEGLGLTIAEAMYLNKPVIATAYSGNMDFMTRYNSYPVDYKIIDVHPNDYPPFEKGYVWADPDVDHATELMRYVYHNKDIAKKLGEKAGVEIKSLLDTRTAGERIRQHLQDIYTKLGH